MQHGNLDEALVWYDKAIESAKEHQFPNSVALGYELKGRFWLERAPRAYALNDLKEAHAGYCSWGASGKVAMLEEEFPELVAGRRGRGCFYSGSSGFAFGSQGRAGHLRQDRGA